MVIGVDPGKTGGIAIETNSILMPTVDILVKEAIYQFALKDGKKQLIKSGKNAGEYKKKIRTPAKYKTELDVKSIFDIFTQGSIVVTELPGNTRGNAAKATATTFTNFGKLLALAELAGCEIVQVPANKWKKDLGVTKDKEQCVALAEELSGLSFRTERGALLDGPAEAWLIRHWYINYKENT